MAFSSIEIIALIFALGIIVKMLFVWLSPKSWMSFAKSLYSSPAVLMTVEFILAIIVLHYLRQTLTIVQIVSCLVLGALLTGMIFAAYSREIISPMMKSFKNGIILKKAWLPIIIWLALAVWVLLEIL